MKWFLIFLAIGLAASDKLDRTYLPPPGAQFAGGSLGDIDVPLELPHPTHTSPGNGQIGGQGSQTNYGINFGDKIPKLPTTTTSYAFSQTTTYPPAEGYETTAFPINPVTGLPVQLDQGNYGLTQGQQNNQIFPSNTQNQGNNFGTNVQPGFGPQGPASTPATSGNPNYGQPGYQPLNQYPGQNVISPGGAVQIPGSVFQTPGQDQGLNQYPIGQNYETGQQSLIPTDELGNQAVNQYTGQNVNSPGGTVQIPGGNQGFTQYPGGQMTITGSQGVLPSASPQEMLLNGQSGGNQYGGNYDNSQGQASQGTYSGQPNNIQNLSGPQLNQASYQNQEPLNVGGIPSQQYPTGNQNLAASGPGAGNVYQPGSTPTVPSSYYNAISSTTPTPDFPSSTSAYSSVGGPIYRPERPQAAADRNAVILNYENIRTPNGYSYSYDTSNGIHADENGIVDNGTKAQGSYSYTGDDGKVYSVIYTADENGFQPRGDHLPTPPPIPEAIKRVIEQAARDKAAGIFDDGSYDEAKYGDKKYQGTANRRRPEKNQIKPIVGLKYDDEYDEATSPDQLNNNLLITSTRARPSSKLPFKQPSNQISDGSNYRDIPGENRRVSETGEDNAPFSDVDEDGMPLTGVNDQFNNFGTKKEGSVKGFPMSSEDNVPFTEDTNQQNQYEPNRRLTSGGVKGMQTKYPGSKDEFNDNEDRKIDIGSPNFSNGQGKDMATKLDSVTGAPLVGIRKQTSNLRPKGNRRPGGPGNRRSQIQKIRPQGQILTQESTDAPSISNYIKNSAMQPNSNQYGTKQDENGYHYQSPKTEFSQNKFPTRFSPQELSPAMKPNQRKTGFEQGTTRRPFITPNVYNQNDGTRPSTTRRPFTTVGVTSPTESSYTDYDDSDDYETDQDIDDQNTIDPAGKAGITSRPNQMTQTTSIPHYTPGGQRTSLAHKDLRGPGHRTENSGTITPGYTFGSTTPMPSHSSRFGSTEASRSEKPQQRGQSPTVPGSTAVGRPVTTQTPSGSRPSDYGYQTTGPVSGYSGSNVVLGYPSNSVVPGIGSVSSTPGSSNYSPSQGYSSTTAVPPTSGYDLGSGSLGPSRTPEGSQPSPTEIFHTGYHYGPPKSGYSATAGPGSGFFSPSGIPGVSQTSTPGTYQTTYQPGYGSFSGTSPAPGRPGTFILSQPGTSAPEFQANYPNGPSTPDYSTMIVSSTPGASPVFGYPGSFGTSNLQTPGYEYRTSKPSYSTTSSPTVGTTPSSFVSSGSPSQGYSTTYRPGFQTTQQTNVGGPLVDGFGRPITSEQGSSYPGYSQPRQDSKGPLYQGPGFTGPSTVSNVLLSGNRPVDNSSSGYGSTESTPYPGSYDQTRIVGEDFSGPKQPQRFDPETGYHYK